jgi:hypothetical protein
MSLHRCADYNASCRKLFLPVEQPPRSIHRFSSDHGHVLSDLRERFDVVLAELEAVTGWQTARIRRPVLILGSRDGVETGVRQLRRARPLETTVMRVGAHDVVLPTLPEVLRIKAFLCLERNATRDYLDLAALASHMGIDAAAEALWSMDELYPQKNGDPWAVRTQLVMQLAAPSPYDRSGEDLDEYKSVRPPFDRWSYIAEVCGQLSNGIRPVSLVPSGRMPLIIAFLMSWSLHTCRDRDRDQT